MKYWILKYCDANQGNLNNRPPTLSVAFNKICQFLPE